MQIQMMSVEELIPYINNPRQNDHAVDAVASSIKNFGFKNPIVVDDHNEIINGHTRLKAAKKLGLAEVPVIVASDLSPEQIKAFRLADNKVSELAEWDEELLEQELNSILMDMSEFGFEDIANSELVEEMEERYTQKIEVPQYEITGDCPDTLELVDDSKTKQLIERISKSNISEKTKQFLTFAAYRHLVFDYGKIAEYYAHADEDVQSLMEESALVIIDFDNALANGYAKLAGAIEEMRVFSDE